MIERYDVNEEWAHTGIIKAGDFCFLSYCVGNIGGTIEQQINGAFDEMEKRLAKLGLTLEISYFYPIVKTWSSLSPPYVLRSDKNN